MLRWVIGFWAVLFYADTLASPPNQCSTDDHHNTNSDIETKRNSLKTLGFMPGLQTLGHIELEKFTARYTIFDLKQNRLLWPDPLTAEDIAKEKDDNNIELPKIDDLLRLKTETEEALLAIFKNQNHVEALSDQDQITRPRPVGQKRSPTVQKTVDSEEDF